MSDSIKIVCPDCGKNLMERVIMSMAEGRRLTQQVIDSHKRNGKCQPLNGEG